MPPTFCAQFPQWTFNIYWRAWWWALPDSVLQSLKTKRSQTSKIAKNQFKFYFAKLRWLGAYQRVFKRGMGSLQLKSTKRIVQIGDGMRGQGVEREGCGASAGGPALLLLEPPINTPAPPPPRQPLPVRPSPSLSLSISSVRSSYETHGAARPKIQEKENFLTSVLDRCRQCEDVGRKVRVRFENLRNHLISTTM